MTKNFYPGVPLHRVERRHVRILVGGDVVIEPVGERVHRPGDAVDAAETLVQGGINGCHGRGGRRVGGLGANVRHSGDHEGSTPTVVKQRTREAPGSAVE